MNRFIVDELAAAVVALGNVHEQLVKALPPCQPLSAQGRVALEIGGPLVRAFTEAQKAFTLALNAANAAADAAVREAEHRQATKLQN